MKKNIMKDFYNNRKIWISGASSGIGKAMALMLSKYNTRLILTSENISALKEVQKECQSFGSECEVYLLDLSIEEQVSSVTKKIIDENYDLSVLILNSGISQRAYAVDTDYEVHKRLIQINFHSNVLITKLVLPIMLINKEGYIGVTSSISGKFGFHLRSSYAASKHALHGYFESVGLENLNNNISVTLVCPGRVQTNISLNALEADGKSYGKMDEGQAQGITAEKCAYQYLEAIKKRRREKLIGGKELLMVYFKRFCPCLFNYLAKKIKPT